MHSQSTQLVKQSQLQSTSPGDTAGADQLVNGTLDLMHGGVHLRIECPHLPALNIHRSIGGLHVSADLVDNQRQHRITGLGLVASQQSITGGGDTRLSIRQASTRSFGVVLQLTQLEVEHTDRAGHLVTLPHQVKQGRNSSIIAIQRRHREIRQFREGRACLSEHVCKVDPVCALEIDGGDLFVFHSSLSQFSRNGYAYRCVTTGLEPAQGEGTGRRRGLAAPQRRGV